MNKTLIQKFNEEEKWKDFFNLKAFEVKFSLAGSILFLIICLLLNAYSEFSNYVEPIQEILSIYIQALIGLIGIIIAGVAIVVSLLNKELIKTMQKVNKKDRTTSLFTSFEFFAFIIAINVFILTVVYFLLHTSFSVPNAFWFYAILSVITYVILFILFYAVSLISNIVKIFRIANLYKEISDLENDTTENANNLRIDFLMHALISNQDIDKKKFLRSLNGFVDNSELSYEQKVRMKKYFENYYKNFF